jgi:hypothetical protein
MEDSFENTQVHRGTARNVIAACYGRIGERTRKTIAFGKIAHIDRRTHVTGYSRGQSTLGRIGFRKQHPS